MDIGMKASDCDFSFRAAALIIENDSLLAVKHDDLDCLYTIGGGVNVNETSYDAVVREAYEETGHHFSVDRLAFIQERFYSLNNDRHHEVVFFYLMNTADVNIENGTCTDHKEEKLHWLPISELNNVNIVPEFLKTALTNIPTEIVHIISKE